MSEYNGVFSYVTVGEWVEIRLRTRIRNYVTKYCSKYLMVTLQPQSFIPAVGQSPFPSG